MGKYYNGSFRASGNAGRLQGENAEGVLKLDELLQQAERKHGFRLKGDTLVVGGSAEALRAARTALECGSENATVVCVQQIDDVPAGPEEVAAAKQAGVRIICGWAPTRISVHSDRRVSGMFFKHCDRAYDDQGRFRPQYDEDNVMAQYCDNLILSDD